MTTQRNDPHGIAPDRSHVALLIIDVINDFDFPEAEQLLRYALPMAQRLVVLKERAKKEGVPVIYVNDNFGRWQSDFKAQVEYCLRREGKGRQIVDLLRPARDDYFVLKPKHSGFYCSALEVLLSYLGTSTLVLTGVAGNICVLFTANDAYMRDFRLVVPRDCVASNTEEANQAAIEEMRRVLKADVRAAHEISLSDAAP
jgi:nicotinamidase-related amidase